MKKPLIIALQRGNASRLHHFLHSCGYNGQVFTEREEFQTALMENRPDLVLVDSAAGVANLLKNVCPVLELQKPDEHLCLPDFTLLYEHLQSLLPDSPRKHLRAEIELPSLFFKKKECLIGRILSLGTGGVFISSACLTIQSGDRVQVVLPLWGIQKELEIRGQVAYRSIPSRDNNYRQGIGICFSPAESKAPALIRDYLRDYFTGNVAVSSSGNTRPPGNSSPLSPLHRSMTLEQK
jgi:Tfp pilus assembly protein PilZ